MSSRLEPAGPEPRDLTLEPISAPIVTSNHLKALIDSPQFHQTIILPSGRTVSFTTCGSKTGTPVLYFYGLGGSSRQIASIHAQALRLDIKLICVDRPGTGFTDPYKSSSSILRRKDKRSSKQVDIEQQHLASSVSEQFIDSETGTHTGTAAAATGFAAGVVIDSGDDDNDDNDNDGGRRGSGLLSRRQSQDSKKVRRMSRSVRKINERVHQSCLEAITVVDHLIPGARFSLMGHSCGTYYIMRMVELFPDRILPGPISLLTPWVPFNECPETTSRTFKFLKHVPKGIVWAVTSSINHLGSIILSSSNALSGAWFGKNLNDNEAEDLEVSDDEMHQESGKNGTKKADQETAKKPAEPFIVQFSDAFDKVLLPALVQDMNRQHSNGYNSEIQMCISDVGFDLANIKLPAGVTINAYCGQLDDVVPIEASREMGKKCGWTMHEFKYSGHGGPRMSMYALEDYALAVQNIKATKIVEGKWSEKHS